MKNTTSKPQRWVVHRVTISSEAKRQDGTIIRHMYPLHVEGFNEMTGMPFSWTVMDLNHPAYDLSRAEMPPDVAAVIESLRLHTTGR